MSLNLTPISPGALALSQIPSGTTVSAYYGVSVYGVDSYGTSTGGVIPVTLTPVSPVTLTITPDT